MAPELITLVNDAADTLGGELFAVYQLDARQNQKTNEFNLPRVPIKLSDLSANGLTCLLRMQVPQFTSG